MFESLISSHGNFHFARAFARVSARHRERLCRFAATVPLREKVPRAIDELQVRTAPNIGAGVASSSYRRACCPAESLGHHQAPAIKGERIRGEPWRKTLAGRKRSGKRAGAKDIRRL